MKWLLVLAMTAACYDEPRPVCGFRCGPAQECPESYTCAADGRCHLNGSDPNLVCGTIDAAVPDAFDAPELDAPPDAPGDAFVPDAFVFDAFVPDAAIDAP
jgi:hypothetical protein